MHIDDEEFDHVVTAWTVGDLRKALEGVSDDMPLVAWVADEPGSDLIDSEQVIVSAGFGQVDEGNGLREDRSQFGLGLEFPTGRYYRPKRR
ncbi:DUF6225 family protein [Saccharopolyspora shandongensis]|uniref:DUF6225 family protein n=1 Tax=Saccharopolyspora shandongensis TaxID=418495 RepID=UPI0033EC43D5